MPPATRKDMITVAVTLLIAVTVIGSELMEALSGYASKSSPCSSSSSSSSSAAVKKTTQTSSTPVSTPTMTTKLSSTTSKKKKSDTSSGGKDAEEEEEQGASSSTRKTAPLKKKKKSNEGGTMMGDETTKGEEGEVTTNKKRRTGNGDVQAASEKEESPATARGGEGKKKKQRTKQPLVDDGDVSESEEKKTDDTGASSVAHRSSSKATAVESGGGPCPQGLSPGHKAPLCSRFKQFCPLKGKGGAGTGEHDHEGEEQSTAKTSLDCSPASTAKAQDSSLTKLLGGGEEVFHQHPFFKMMRKTLLDEKITLITDEGLQNVADAVENMKEKNLPGVYAEAGVWKGGASIYARVAMDILGLQKRISYLFDSYCGLPVTDSKAFANTADAVQWHTVKWLRVSVEDVKRYFETMCVPSNRARFVKGFFDATLPGIRDEFLKSNQTIGALRIDGDIYESTADVLYLLYDLVDVGGYVIIDDWVWEALQYHAKLAVLDFFHHHGLSRDHHMQRVDDTRAFFVKKRHVDVKLSLYETAKKKGVRSTSRDDWGEAEYLAQRLRWEKKHDSTHYMPHNTPRRELSKWLAELEVYIPRAERKPWWAVGLYELGEVKHQFRTSLEGFASFYFSFVPFPSTCKKTTALCAECPVVEDEGPAEALPFKGYKFGRRRRNEGGDAAASQQFCKLATQPRM